MMEKTIKISSVFQAEEDMIKYYAFLDWEKAVANVEILRKRIWSKKLGIFPAQITKIGSIKKLKD